jgi:hypothetical protein
MSDSEGDSASTPIVKTVDVNGASYKAVELSKLDISAITPVQSPLTSGKPQPSSTVVGVEDIMNAVSQMNIDKKHLSVGYYRLSSERQMVRYVYVPGKLMRSANFDLDDVFQALEITQPNLIFEICNCEDIDNWNVKLPPYRSDLIGKDHPNPAENVFHGGLKHYQGVIEENCKRLIKGTVAACSQANAIFRSDGVFSNKEGMDQVASWICTAGGKPVILAACSFDEFDFELVTKKMLTNMIPFTPTDEENEDDKNAMFKKSFVIDTAEWYRQDDPRTNSFNENGL